MQYKWLIFALIVLLYIFLLSVKRQIDTAVTAYRLKTSNIKTFRFPLTEKISVFGDIVGKENISLLARTVPPPPLRLPEEGLSLPLSACTDGSYTDSQKYR